MNIEKALISAIIALGIAGSAALAAGGRFDSDAARDLTPPATICEEAGEALGGGLITAHAFDSHEQFLGL